MAARNNEENVEANECQILVAAELPSVEALQFPLDLENYERTWAADKCNPGDVIVYVGDNRRRYLVESERTWLLRVTRTDSQNIYGTDVYPRQGFEPDDEFVIVDGQVEHHGVYVIRRALTQAAPSSPVVASDPGGAS